MILAVAALLAVPASAFALEPEFPDPELGHYQSAGAAHLGVGVLLLVTTVPAGLGIMARASDGADPAARPRLHLLGYTSFRFGVAFGVASIVHGGRMLKYGSPKKRPLFGDLVDNPTWRHLHWISPVLLVSAAAAMPSMLRYVLYPGLSLDAAFLEGIIESAAAIGCLVAGVITGGAARAMEDRARLDDLEWEDFDPEGFDLDLDFGGSYLRRLPPPLVALVPVPGGATAIVVGAW